MEHHSKFINPTETIKKKHKKKNYNKFTKTKNDNDGIVIDDLNTQSCIIQNNIEKNQNYIKDTELDNDIECIFPTSWKVSKHNNSKSSDTDCSITNIKTVSESNDIVHKKAAAFIKKVFHKELPKNNKQLSLILMIQSRRLTKLSHIHFEDAAIKKATDIFCSKSRYAKQKNDKSVIEDLHSFWLRKFQKLTKFVNDINDHLETLVRVPNTAIKHVRNSGTNVNMSVPRKRQPRHVPLYNLPDEKTH